ncbi:hypothetical protein ACHAQE_000188 [Botrytis cinerea]
MAIAQVNISSSRLQQRRRKAAPPALSIGVSPVRAPHRRVSHHRKVELVSASNMSRDDPPSPPPNPPPNGSAFEAQAGVLSRYKFAAFAWGHIIGGRDVETELL